MCIDRWADKGRYETIDLKNRNEIGGGGRDSLRQVNRETERDKQIVMQDQ